MLVPDIYSAVSYVNSKAAVVEKCNVEIIAVLKILKNFSGKHLWWGPTLIKFWNEGLQFY